MAPPLVHKQDSPHEQAITLKLRQRKDAIPLSWKLPQRLMSDLKLPLESSKNNLIGMDFPRQSGIMTEEELHITESYDVAGLLQALASGELTCMSVTVAFCKRAAIAHQLTNCLTEIFFQKAMWRARQLDLMREHGYAIGPLHGLPISLKDSCQVTGVPATLGFVSYLQHVSTENSAIVNILLELGAVLYCKTNVPQTLMTADSHNHVFGRTLNPWNTALTAGGSSGGEGALIAMRGSLLGVGTDIGGSIRIPALCCGTYGFRPTSGRIPYGGLQSCSDKGLRTVMPCAGPLATDVATLELFMKCVIDTRPRLRDATVVDVPWRDVSGAMKPKLRLGVLLETDEYPLHPSVRTAMCEALRLLADGDHELITLSPEECLVHEATQVAWSLFSFDDTADRVAKAGGEDPIPSRIRLAEEMSKLPFDFTSSLDGLPDLKRLSALNLKRMCLADAWRKIWVKYGLDAVVGPASQSTATPHDTYGVPPYTLLLNVLDYPACVIPLKRVTAATAIGKEDFQVKSGETAPPYNAEDVEGAPNAFQVFTSTMRDEECLEISKMLDRCVNEYDLTPISHPS